MKHFHWLAFFGVFFLSFQAAGEPAGSTDTFIPVPQFNALLQVWTLSDAAVPRVGMRLRRAELRMGGTVIPSLRYLLMVDPAKLLSSGDRRILQDWGVGYSPFKNFEILVGQFKNQTSAEGLASTARLLLPERSVTSRLFGDKRDTGLMVSYTTPDWKLAMMVSALKDLTTRADFFFSKQFSAGAFLQLGNLEYAKNASWGLNSRVSPFRDLWLAVEYDQGRVAGVQRWGVVFEADYAIDPHIQAVMRHEILSPNSQKPEFAQQFMVGVDYLLLKQNAKFQVAVGSLTHIASNNGSPRVSLGSSGPTGTVAFQAAL